jgi:hypothetical protein
MRWLQVERDGKKLSLEDEDWEGKKNEAGLRYGL